jgi:hypothetical protein
LSGVVVIVAAECGDTTQLVSCTSIYLLSLLLSYMYNIMELLETGTHLENTNWNTKTEK